MIVAAFFGSIYYNLSTPSIDDTDSSSAYNNRLALIFFTLMFNLVCHQDAVPVIFDERLLFYRERGAKAYGAFPYWVTTWILRIPVTTISTALFAAIVYNLSNLSDKSGRFSFYFGVLCMHSFAASFMMQSIAAISSSTAAAMSLVPVAVFLNIVFAGFLVYVNEFSAWLGAWGPYISFFRFSFQAAVINELADNSDLPLGQQYIDNLGFDEFSKEYCANVLMLFMFTYATLSLLGLRFIDFEAR
jgi:ABC-type multidrug transport system permease subunit